MAREASDIVLQDDRFATIVTAVDQGRVIFDNIRKFVVYLLSCNASEIMAVSISFLTLATSQILHVFNMAEPEARTFLNEVTRNRWVWGAVVLCGGLVAAAAYLEPLALASVLDVTAPGRAGWALVAGLSAAPLVLGRTAHAALRASSGLRRRLVGSR